MSPITTRRGSAVAAAAALTALVGSTLVPLAPAHAEQQTATADLQTMAQTAWEDAQQKQTEPNEPVVVYEEDFDDLPDGELPEGWSASSGTWEVIDGRLRAIGEDTVNARFTPDYPSMTDFRVESTIQFEEVLDPSRWIHLVTEGNSLTIRSQTTHEAGIEYWGANSNVMQPGPFDVGVGQDFESVIEVHGQDLTWTIDGTEVLSVDDYGPRGTPEWGFNVNNSTMQFDDIRITNLNPQSLPASAPVFPQLDEREDAATISWSKPEYTGEDLDGVPADIEGYEASIAPATVPEDEVEWTTADGTRHEFTQVAYGEQQVLRVRAVNSLGLAGESAEVRTIGGADAVDGNLMTLSGGAWPSGHVQGIAADTERGLVYFSFTDRLVVTDRAGNVLGSLTGMPGHLGDLVLNPENGKVYGALYWTNPDTQQTEFVTAIFDPEHIDEFNADITGNPAFSMVPITAPDGIGFGPAFGTSDGEWLLTTSIGHPHNNEYQYFAQYDVSELDEMAVPFESATKPPAGSIAPEGHYSVYTGTVAYNCLQNMAYDPSLERWFMGVYVGSDPQFPNYSMFAVEANAEPTLQTFKGTDEQGLVIPLADDGLLHEASGIRGWNQKADMGIQALGNGLFYLSQNSLKDGMESSTLTLNSWTGDPDQPFAPATAADGGAPSTGDIPVEAEVPGLPGDGTDPEEPGSLVLSIAPGTAAMEKQRDAGDRLRLSGTLPALSVTDTRTEANGWTVSGQSSDLADGEATVKASYLGWSPHLLDTTHGATPGERVQTQLSGGEGLAVPATLGSATADTRLGTSQLGADLELELPVDTESGTYQGAVSVSLFPVD